MATRREFLQQSAAVAAVAGLRAPELLATTADQPPLAQFSYGDVTLGADGASGLAQAQFDSTQSVLLGLNEDSLLRPWRLRAGLPAPGGPLGGWYDEVPLVKTPSGGEGFAPAHAFGQWLSAMARGYAATGSPATQAKLRRLLEMYGPAISGRFYTNFRFPAYDYDKVVIGLIDAHTFAGMPEAFSLLDRVTDAAAPHLEPEALDRDAAQRAWRASIGENTTDDYTWDEPYTLPENLYLAAERGAGDRYRQMARRYLLDKTWFDPLSLGENVLDGHHAYSFCNSLSSAMEAWLSDGSRKHLEAARNGLAMIEAQSYATGGWGPDESFRQPGTGALFASLTNTHHHFETPCGAYAHFKITRSLLRTTRDGHYGDSMERVFYNTVLGARPLEADGQAFYYSDYSGGGSKFYFTDKWPCCAGTLPQVAADYRISAYLREGDDLWVNLYLPSTVRWVASNGAEVKLTQSGGYPVDGQVNLRINSSRPTRFAMKLRIPAWAGSGGAANGGGVVRVLVNGAPQRLRPVKGFVALEREWKSGDRVELNLPMPLRLEAIEPEHPETVALMAGPLVLLALGAEMPKVTRQALLAAQKTGEQSWEVAGADGAVTLKPFTAITDEHYWTYLTV